MEDTPDDTLPPLKPLPPVHHPMTLWQQDAKSLMLKIQLANAEKISLRVTSKQLLFWVNHEGKRYVLLITFYGEVNPSKTTHTAFGNYVSICLEKFYFDAWPRLCESSEKIPYIQYDASGEDGGDYDAFVSFGEIRRVCGVPIHEESSAGLPPEAIRYYGDDSDEEDDDDDYALERALETDSDDSDLAEDNYDG